MPLERITNNATTTLSASVNNSSDPVTFTVADASDFPDSGNFRVIIDDEILLVTSVSGTSFTASRAQESTTIASHSSGAAVAGILTTQGLLNLISQYSKSPYQVFTPTGVDDEFDDASFSGWTAVESGSPTLTITEVGSQLSIYNPGGDGGGVFHAFMKSTTINTGDSIEICFRMMEWNESYAIVAVMMGDGATYGSGSQVFCTWSPQQGLASLMNHSGYNSNNDNASYGIFFMGSGYIFLRLTYVSSNTFKGQISCDGVNWITLNASYSRTMTPTHVGFGLSKWGGSNPMMVTVEYFKKR